MAELKLEDYYSAADKARDAAAISLFFDKSRKYKMHLDGVRMIDQFVRPNQMTRWTLTKKTKKLRESCVQQSYGKLKNMAAMGRLDHIPVP